MKLFYASSSTVLAVSVLLCAGPLLSGCGGPSTETGQIPSQQEQVPRQQPVVPGQASLSSDVPSSDLAPNEWLMRINGLEVKNAALNREMHFMAAQMTGDPNRPVESPRVKKNALQSLVNQQVLLQESDKRDLEITEQDKEQALAQLTQLTQRMNPDPNTPVWETLGMTEESFEDWLTINVKIDKLVQVVAEEVSAPTEGQLQEWYDAHPEAHKQQEQVQASHILLKVDENASEEQKESTRSKLSEIRDKIVNGELESLRTPPLDDLEIFADITQRLHLGDL